MEQKNSHNGLNYDFKAPLTEKQAEEIYALGKEAVIFALVVLSQYILAGNDPSIDTPSGMIPPYKKPGVKKKRKKKTSAKPGHPGHTRPPAEPTHHKDHDALDVCPDCGTKLGKEVERRNRIIEDIGETEPEITDHSIPRQWCPHCKKLVEPPVEDALPGATLGNRIVALTAWLHYCVGATLSQIAQVMESHLQFHISEGGLISVWYRLSELLYAWYEEIGDDVKQSGVLHADETGWRVAGKTVWLWCFTTARATYYMIDRSRGSPALSKFFTQSCQGILITDFWAAYNAVVCQGRQACLAHLFREIKKVDDKNLSAQWGTFRKRVTRLLNDAIRLNRKRDAMKEKQYSKKRRTLEKRLRTLSVHPWNDPDARRLSTRLQKYQDAILTFLVNDDVPFTNNHAEREIRPAVIIRKNSQGNRSENGAHTQAILMSIYRTLKLRNHDPLKTIVNAMKSYARNGEIPTLPK